MSDLEKWWTSLQPETRRRLQDDPWSAVPGDLWADVVREEGPLAIGAYWPDVQPGPEGVLFRDEVSEFIASRPHGIAYKGHPGLAGLLAQMLREQGIRVEYEPPMEHRDLPGAAQEVVVNLITWGAIATIKGVIAKFRERPGNADATVEGDPEPDKD
ncbi:MAG: hypothetical protein JWO98_2609 [Frankiales bacterium]|nr:hypothetical protein [Frankiales bacterium]